MLKVALLHPQGNITQEWTFDRDYTYVEIGRSSRCEIRLLSVVVSRRHAILKQTPDGNWRLENLSPSGCYLDDRAIAEIFAIDRPCIVRLAKNGPRLRLTPLDGDDASSNTDERRRKRRLDGEDFAAARDTWLSPEADDD